MMVTIETKILFVAMLVGLAHIASGAAVLVDPASLNVTPLEILARLARGAGYTKGDLAGLVLLTAGILATIGASRGVHATRRARIALFALQEALLILQIVSIMIALITGVYPDGYAPAGGRWFIAADQSWAWVLAVSHSVFLAAFIYGGEAHGRRYQ